MRRVFLLFLLLLLDGCGAALTPTEIATNGTDVFDAPPAKVFAAASAALVGQGYEIVLSKPEKGLIKTNQKVIRADAVGNGNYASAVSVRRQYILHITADAGGKTKVEAVPRVYSGEADVSDGSVWVLDGAAGERTLWKRLFDDIRENL